MKQYMSTIVGTVVLAGVAVVITAIIRKQQKSSILMKEKD